jgi:hypothetical protein
MNLVDVTQIIMDLIIEICEGKLEVTKDMPLVGGESQLDSMKLVEICVALEDLADDSGFEFDWTSDNAMSKSRGIFRSISALSEEFIRQSEKAS